MSDNNNKNTSLEDLDWGLGKVVWAKTNMRDANDLRWSSLAQHSIDTALVAGKVWDKFLPEAVKTQIINGFDNNEDTAKQTVMFLAGCHDAGKATPAFERQAYGAAGEARLKELETHGMTIPQSVVKSSNLRHEISGYWALFEWFKKNNIPDLQAKQLATPVGGHHGVFHEEAVYGKTNKAKLNIYYNGNSPEWDQARQEVINAVASKILNEDTINVWRTSEITLPIQALIAGIITMSDWISSDAYNFWLTSSGLVDASKEPPRVHKGWKNLDLPTPHSWKNPNELLANFPQRFDLPEGATPNAMQKAVIEVAESIQGNGGMLIIEAPMGGGKTEAALTAAEILGFRNGCGGLAFALPTQATSDGILPRLATWAFNGEDNVDSIKLIHGRAALNEDYQNIREGAMYDDEKGVGLISNRWLDGTKRGLLANLVTCTIDQILMMALQAKHYDLRHLGLAGKVIIIDEVHAADDYMMVYLDKALEWLGSYSAPVVLLSATLPKRRRKELANAYRRGMAKNEAFTKSKQLKHLGHEEEYASAYPLITKVDRESAELIPLSAIGDGDDQSLSSVEESKSYQVSTGGIEDLKGLLADGGNALIIRNTVSRAQATYEALVEDSEFDDWDVNLLHARFVSTDRKKKEQRLRNAYGKNAVVDSYNDDGVRRPSKSILIATQVVEQSLDVDFDVMLTDVCPMDLLLQRMGRVHRHSVHDPGRPNGLKTPKVLIDGWEHKDRKIKTDYGSQLVYGPSKLLRTIALTGFENGRTIEIPSQISPLVQSAYDLRARDNTPSYDETIVSEMLNEAPDGVTFDSTFVDQLWNADLALYLENKRSREDASKFLLRTPFRMNMTDAADHKTLLGSNCKVEINSEEKMQAQVRDSAMGVGCILMVRDGDYARFVDCLGDGELDDQWGMIPLDHLDDQDSLDVVLKISSQSIGLPPALSNPGRIDAMIRWMEENCRIDGWQDSKMLRGEFVLLLDGDGERKITLKNSEGMSSTFVLSYDSELGLRCTELKK